MILLSLCLWGKGKMLLRRKKSALWIFFHTHTNTFTVHNNSKKNSECPFSNLFSHPGENTWNIPFWSHITAAWKSLSLFADHTALDGQKEGPQSYWCSSLQQGLWTKSSLSNIKVRQKKRYQNRVQWLSSVHKFQKNKTQSQFEYAFMTSTKGNWKKANSFSLWHCATDTATRQGDNSC